MEAIHLRPILLVDPNKCRGCGLCELVCSILHGDGARPSTSRIKVFKDRESHIFKPLVCLQCYDPKCMRVCPKRAIYVDGKTGAKIINEKICDGCGLCADACPFKLEDAIIFKHPSKKAHIKCDMCYQNEEGPGCIEFCPSQAIILKKGRI
jgi:carbon-monoxide dehydrogenase iron sulfur subunit